MAHADRKKAAMSDDATLSPVELLTFLRAHRLAVEATVTEEGAPQAAVVGYGVSDRLEIVFDTLSATRKLQNLKRNDRIALVIGWDEAKTLQIDGVADLPEGDELERIRAVYFQAYPDGRDRLSWPGLVHVRVRPRWARLSDFTVDPPRIRERSVEDIERAS